MLDGAGLRRHGHVAIAASGLGLGSSLLDSGNLIFSSESRLLALELTVNTFETKWTP